MSRLMIYGRLPQLCSSFQVQSQVRQTFIAAGNSSSSLKPAPVGSEGNSLPSSLQFSLDSFFVFWCFMAMTWSSLSSISAEDLFLPVSFTAFPFPVQSSSSASSPSLTIKSSSELNFFCFVLDCDELFPCLLATDVNKIHQNKKLNSNFLTRLSVWKPQ